MKKTFIFIVALVLLFSLEKSKAQTFNAISGIPIDLDLGTTNFSSCATPGNKCNIQFSVTGVGLLSSVKALTKVNIQFDASCGGNLKDVALFLKSPSGTCMRIYRGNGLSTSYSGLVNLSMVDGLCLNEPVSANLSTSATTNTTSSGNFGTFDANPGSELASVFVGENADGTWTIYGFESAVSAPCINSMSIEFANPTVQDQTANGDNCASAIEWQGGPICAGTNAKASSALMPGSLSGGTTFGTIGGSTCNWNANNNNDVWIRFSPNVSGNTCVSISGLDFSLQSVVVTDANADGDNDPCTYSGVFPNPAGNDPRWTLVSCPTTSGIYTTTAGSQLSQQHCFTANANQSYYLVVDGNGGAETDFYITGTAGSFTPLSVEYLSFSGKNRGAENYLEWTTTNEQNNAYFEIEKSTNGFDFKKIGTLSTRSIDGQGAFYDFVDKDIKTEKNYYRVKQIDIDQKYSYSSLVTILNNRKANAEAVLQNQTLSFTNIDKEKKLSISIMDLSGKVIYQQNNDTPISVQTFSRSMYFIRIENGQGVVIQKMML